MADLLAQLQEHLVARGAYIPGWRADAEERGRFQARVAQALIELRAGISDEALAGEAERLAGQMTGVGALTPLLSEPGVEEIIVRNGHVQIERRGRIEEPGPLADDAHFLGVAMRAADLGGRTLKADQPFVLVDLPSGDRLTAMIPPLSVSGVAMNIRVFAQRGLTFHDLQSSGAFARRPFQRETIQSICWDAALSSPVARFLAGVAAGNLATTLISGEFSSGKTTLLNAMSRYFPRTLQLAVVETFQELQLQHPFAARAVVPVESREGGVTMRQVVNTLYTRMRPDAIVVGEIVGGEAVEFLQAANLGKKAYATIHGNSPLDALYHLEDLDLRSGLPFPAIRERIARGVNLIVHTRQDRETGARYVSEICALDEQLTPEGDYRLFPLYRAEGRHTPVTEELARLWMESEAAL